MPLPDDASVAHEQAQHRACLAGFSRLVASAINEHLVVAHVVDVVEPRRLSGDIWCFIQFSVSETNELDGFLIKLKHFPIQKRLNDGSIVVAHLHPQDISNVVLDVVLCSNRKSEPIIQDKNSIKSEHESAEIRLSGKAIIQAMITPSKLDVVDLVARISRCYPHPVDRDTLEQLQAELASSVHHATYAFLHSPMTPKISQSSAIEWEQSIVEGHATHPMHKARLAVPPVLPVTDKDTEDLKRVDVRLAAVPRSSVHIRGDLPTNLNRILPTNAFSKAYTRKEGFEFIPVHPLQLPNIKEKFPSAIVLENIKIPSLAQASIRTVIPSHQQPQRITLSNGMVVDERVVLKLALGIKVTSALRTVTPKTCYQGPGLSDIFSKLEKLVPDNRLIIWPEAASIWPNHPDEDIAKHMSCVVRLERVPVGETAIIAAALTEEDPSSGKTRCEVAFGLSSEEEKRRFLQVYAEQLFACFLPSVTQAGFAFESHPQNTLLRVKPVTSETRGEFKISQNWECTGFAIRDFGGIKVHRETLRHQLDEELDVLPDACTVADTMDDVYKLAYHTLVFCQLQALVRGLKLHDTGFGWQIVRHAFKKHCRPESELYDKWLGHGWVWMKSFMKMKMDGLYRDYLYDLAPNMLVYPSEDVVRTRLWWAEDEHVVLDDES